MQQHVQKLSAAAPDKMTRLEEEAKKFAAAAKVKAKAAAVPSSSPSASADKSSSDAPAFRCAVARVPPTFMS